jgi:hypothetical protein
MLMPTEYFIIPLRIGITEQSTLWLLPLILAISVVYKTTKMQKITVGAFLKEVIVLSGSIVVFMIATAVIIFAVAWLITD